MILLFTIEYLFQIIIINIYYLKLDKTHLHLFIIVYYHSLWFTIIQQTNYYPDQIKFSQETMAGGRRRLGEQESHYHYSREQTRNTITRRGQIGPSFLRNNYTSIRTPHTLLTFQRLSSYKLFSSSIWEEKTVSGDQ